MERKFYTDNFEQLLKEKSDEFRMYPSKRVWHSIYNDLHPGRKWPSIAVSMFLSIVLLLVGYWNSNNNKSSTKTIATTTTNVPNNTTGNILSNTNTTALNTVLANGANSNIANHNKTTVVQPAVVSANTSTVKNNNQQITFATNKNNSLSNNQKYYFKKEVVKANGNEKNNAVAANTSQVIAAAIINLINKEASTTSFTTTDLINQNQDKATNIEEVFVATINKIDAVNTTKEIAIEAIAKENNTVKATTATNKKTISTEEKAWIEDYAFHNKSKRKKWQDRTAIEFYVTPNVGYRKITNDSKYNVAAVSSPTLYTAAGIDANKAVSQKPGLGLEVGVGINYAIAKNIRVKAGIQANYTNYGVNATETNHPILTTLMLIDANSGYPYMHSVATTLSNTSGSQPVKVHNKTYQVAIPIGVALKLSGNSKLEWYTGATIQPTMVFGGKAYLISADRKNYVADASSIRKWNVNTSIETYINYKFDGFTLMAGPQFRYQLLSTYNKKYTVKENLFNAGIKIGIVKNL